MAEILIYAKNHWMDALTQQQVNALSENDKAGYDRRLQKGDIVSVHPDGSLSEHAHSDHAFIVVKLVGLSYETAKEYIKPLIENYTLAEPAMGATTARRIKKRRKFNIPKNWVENKIANNEYHIIITNQALINNIISSIETKV